MAPAVHERIAGVLLGAAIGDAMGAATELRTPAQITECFGGPVTSFVPAPDDTFARGCPAGSITDDFSQAYYLAKALVARGGITAGDADEVTGREAILAWWQDERFQVFAGPTTRSSVERLLGLPIEELFFLYRGGQATNGAAMRIAPVGCVAGTVESAIDAAIRISLPTHDNHLATGAAALIAAGVRAGLETEFDVGSRRPFASLAEACVEIASATSARARELSYVVPGAEIEDRLGIALSIGSAAGDASSAALAIARTVGCGIAANEAVPAAIGILAAATDPIDAIVAAVNAGDDADTVATMVGALAGAVFGEAAFPSDLVETVQRVNDIDLNSLASDLEAVRQA